jgi:predicted oxidoreductase
MGLGYTAPITTGAEFTVEINRGLESDGTFQGAGGVVDYCRANTIQLQAWSPLRGVLNRGPDANAQVREAAQRLETLAQQKGTTLPTLALAWLLRHPAGILPFTGASKPEHIIENCAADRVSLSREEWYDCLAAATNLQGT